MLEIRKDIEFCVLVGSQANNTYNDSSDWDLAIQWTYQEKDMFRKMTELELLRHKVAAVLAVDIEQIDLIDIDNAQLSMREKIANNGVLLCGEEKLSWNLFLDKTWRQLEMWQWDKQHVL